VPKYLTTRSLGSGNVKNEPGDELQRSDPLRALGLVVIDPSAILAVLLNEPERDSLIAATERVVLIAPASLPWAVGNALIAGLRRKRLSQNDVLTAWKSYEEIPLRLVEVNMVRALKTAAEHGLYAYDAYVLEAALTRRLPLLTLDKVLAQAAEQAGVALVEV
jgi:predicted nucleic acid-binding protein